MLDYAKNTFNLQQSYYFNSGFMFINLKNWQKEQISEKAIELLTKKK